MIDTATPKGRLIAAALELARTRPWAEVTLVDIAAAAGMPLVELRKHVGAKSQIVSAFMRIVDDTVLTNVASREAGQSTRDALFEVIMARFDALTPHKAALRSIRAAGAADPALLTPFLNSQRWMLAAAGVDVDGAGGLVRTLGLGSIYASVFSTWLADDDPGMARTMAALDQRLRSGVRTLETVEDAVGGVRRVITDLPGVLRATFTRRAKPAEPTSGDPANPV